MSRVKMLIHRGNCTYKDPVKVIVDGNCNNSDWKCMPNEEQGKSESRQSVCQIWALPLFESARGGQQTANGDSK